MSKLVGELQFAKEISCVDKQQAVKKLKSMGCKIVSNKDKYYIIKEAQNADR